jgi:hypothetical protein
MSWSAFPRGVAGNTLRRRLPCNLIVILHPMGEPISPHLLCCSAFAVEGPQLHALRLASAATSARE